MLHGRKGLEAYVRSGTSVSSAVIRGIKAEEMDKSDCPETMEAARRVYLRTDTQGVEVPQPPHSEPVVNDRGCPILQCTDNGSETNDMNKVILADSQALFRAGTAKLLAMNEDFRIIAQCADVERTMHAITTFPGAIVLVASSLCPDMLRLRMMLESAGSRAIVIAENKENRSTYLNQGFQGVLFRNSTGRELEECVCRVAVGDTWAPQQILLADAPEYDMVGARVRDRFTPKEMRIVALIVQGCKNREIAVRLKTTEQVIKNYLRSIFDKTGVSDRLELALFVIHHAVLAQAAERVGNEIEAEEEHATLNAVA